jgi:hypothetical protein
MFRNEFSFSFLLLVLISLYLIKLISSQTCENQLDYYANQYKSLQEERDIMKTKLDNLFTLVNSLIEENKKISASLTEVQASLNKIKKEQFVMYATSWENKVTSTSHLTIPGLLKVVRVNGNAKLKVTSHFHFLSTERFDVVTFINGVLTGVETQTTEYDLVHGMGLSSSQYFSSGTSIASKSVSAGDYTIEIKAKLPFGGKGTVSGIVTIIEIIYD